MYCIKCGVQIAEGQTKCPVCNTKIYHPDFDLSEEKTTYPKSEFVSEEFDRRGLMFVLTVIFALAAMLPIIIDVNVFGEITWSGYAFGGVFLGYMFFLMPAWFKNANSVIFVPCNFACILLFLLYINLHTNGDWFLTLALPLTVSLGLISTAIAALSRYLKRGRLYLASGAFISLGLWSVFVEFCIHLTFPKMSVVLWSVYPLVSLCVIGLMLLVIAIVKPFKESLRKIFFI